MWDPCLIFIELYSRNKVLGLDSPVFFQMLIKNNNNNNNKRKTEIIMRNVTVHLILIVIRPVKCSGNYIYGMELWRIWKKSALNPFRDYEKVTINIKKKKINKSLKHNIIYLYAYHYFSFIAWLWPDQVNIIISATVFGAKN